MKRRASTWSGSSARMSPGRRLAWSAVALTSTAIALVSSRYLFGKGPVPGPIALNQHFDPWIMVHAASAATALLLGPAQFLPGLRKRMPALHRIVGRVYVAGCLIGGVSGLVLATGASAGPIAGMGFGALGAAWLATTGTAVFKVLRHDVIAHQRWMIRSFALTFSAVTLRIYLPISSLAGIDFLMAYRVISWMCWVPNLLLAQWYLDRRQTLGK